MARSGWTDELAERERVKQHRRVVRAEARALRADAAILELEEKLARARKAAREAVEEARDARSNMRCATARCSDCLLLLYGRGGKVVLGDGPFCVLDPETHRAVEPEKLRCATCQERARKDPALVATALVPEEAR